MVVASREQGRAGRGAERRDVEVRVAKARRRETVDVRRLDRRAITAEVGESEVVEQDHDDVGGALTGMLPLRPVWLRLGERPPDHAAKGLVELHRGVLPSPVTPRIVRSRKSAPSVANSWTPGSAVAARSSFATSKRRRSPRRSSPMADASTS